MNEYVCNRCKGCKYYKNIDTTIYDVKENDKLRCCNGSASAENAFECDAYEGAKLIATRIEFTEDNTIKVTTKETTEQKINKIKEYVSKINELIADIEGNKNTNEVNKPEPPKDILAKYNNAIFDQLKNTFMAWYIDNDDCGDNSIEWTNDPNFPKDNPLCYYPNKEYAEKALNLQKLNNALLAFKYCYNADYEPDWEDNDERKYYVYQAYLNDGTTSFSTDYTTYRDMNTIYFSEAEIARKCAKWLNETFRKD